MLAKKDTHSLSLSRCELVSRHRLNECRRARMLANVTLADAAELRAKVDLPFEKIRRVMYFESGFGWMGQHPLSFDPANQNWGAQVGPGNRAAIREHHEIYVWAVATDGLWSECQGWLGLCHADSETDRGCTGGRASRNRIQEPVKVWASRHETVRQTLES